MDISNIKYSYGIVLLIFLVSISAFAYPLISADSGYYLANARDLYNGNKYFIDIATAYNPLSIVVLGLPFLFFDLPDSRLSLAINFIIIFASSYVLFQILKSFSKDKNRNLFFSLFFIFGALVLDGSHIMLEPLSVFFLLIALLLYIKSKIQSRFFTLLCSGIFISLAFLSKQYGLFLLIPLGIDVLLKKEKIITKGFTLALGFLIPIALFVFYLVSNGFEVIEAITYIIGKGVKIDVGSGTGRNFTLFTYSLGYIFFFLCNAYLLLIPLVLRKNWKSLLREKSIFLIIFPFSFLVLVSASYVHYFQYVLPFAILLIAFLYDELTTNFPKLLKISLLFSIGFMILVSVYSFVNKESKFKTQNLEKTTLLENVPAKSKVFFEGPSPAYYYLCNYNSIQLKKIGYTFPGYFYSGTISKNLEIDSYVVIAEDLFYIYDKVIDDNYSLNPMTLSGKKYLVIKRIK